MVPKTWTRSSGYASSSTRKAAICCERWWPCCPAVDGRGGRCGLQRRLWRGHPGADQQSQRLSARPFDTRVGSIELAIPKLREGSYYPGWLLEPRRRAERALVAVVARVLRAWRIHPAGGGPDADPGYREPVQESGLTDGRRAPGTPAATPTARSRA